MINYKTNFLTLFAFSSIIKYIPCGGDIILSQQQAEKLRIISAFRKYTRLGLASGRLSPFDAYARIKGVSRNESDARDLLAVYDTIRLLKISGKNDVLESVYAVYFSYMGRLPKKNEISNRVLRHAYETNCDERTVYRRLEYARRLYKSLRYNY